MSRQEDDREARRWKDKYLDTLEEFEQREKQWQQLEKTLRQGLSRLSLLADDTDAVLSRQLDALRKAVRQGSDGAQLGRLLAEISTSIARLDEKGGGRGAGLSGNRLLSELLGAIRVGRERQAEIRRARRKLDEAGDYSDARLVEEVARFIEGLFTAAPPVEKPAPDESPAATVEVSPAEEAPPARPGLFSRLFGGRQAERQEGVARAVDDAGDEVTAPTPPPATVPNTRGAEAQEEGAAAFSAKADLADMALAAEVLIQLIERIDLPEDLEAESRRVRANIAGRVDWPRISAAISATANIIALMRLRLEAERNELEAFLGQLTLRLREIDDGLQATSRIHHRVQASNTELDDAVSREVGGLEDELGGADIEAIKRAVAARVQAIRRHLSAFRDSQAEDLGSAAATIAALTEKLQQTEAEAETLRSELAAAHQQAVRDPLTGMANRLAYEERLQAELARFARNGTPFCLMVWDVDHFKQVNDTWGHEAGDRVLKILAETLAARLRGVDLVARYGGEEFVVILADTTLEHAMETAEELRGTIATLDFHYRDQPVPITASCGLTQCGEGDDGESLFRRADAALYRAKQAGRNRCEAG